jgi:hypothetical protein
VLEMMMDESEDDIKSLLEAHCDFESKRRMLKRAVEINGNAFNTKQTERDLIDQLGKEFGCHECGKYIERDGEQTWIGDHIPPKNLKTALAMHYGHATPFQYRLYPQCYKCMREQAKLVDDLNSSSPPYKALDPWHTLLIMGSPLNGDYLNYTAKDVDSAASQLIQQLAHRSGCHSCQEDRYPADRYVADHFPPASFMQAYAKNILAHYGIPEITEFHLLPHCPKCSSSQGGRLGALLEEARKESGVYKYPE